MMRTWITGSLIVLASVLVRAQEQPAQPPTCAHAKLEMARFMRGLQPDGRGGGGPCTGTADTDVLHNALDIELDPASAWLGGSNTMTIKSLVDGLTTFQFQLDSVLPISAVQVGGLPASWTRLDNRNVQVTLDRPYNTNEVFTVYVAYSGHPVNGAGLGSITFRYRNGAPEVYTLSEPWFAYTWWPCKNDLTDKSTADLWFTVPDTMVVGSNGLLQGVDNITPGKLRYRWKTNYQTDDYLYSIGATNFHTFDDTWTYNGGTMPLHYFIYPEDDYPGNRAVWQESPTILTTFSSIYGLYPFVNEKFGFLEFGWGGGQEHQTLVSIGGFWEWICVHETSHQWWGDNVTCATWHDIWLNEGFATYSEALFYEYRPGSSGEPALHSYMAGRRPGNVGGTVYCYNDTDVNRIFDYDLTYEKGGWVLHMLRHVIGDTNFFNTLATYRATYQGNSATTDEFRAVAESVSGRDLGWYFNEWVYLGGAPQYSYGWQQYVVDGVGYVELYLKQTQSPTYPIFTMPIDVVTNDAGGAHTHKVWNDAQTENLLFQVESTAVNSINFDPKPWILWTGATPVTFVQGPPKIVTMNPAPNQVVPKPQQPAALEVVFHKDVIAQASDFTLAGQRNGPVSFTYSYDGTRHAAHLTLQTPLPTDTYTLIVHDSIVGTAGGLKLDGELVKPDSPNPLPSGDGVPGGNAVATFYITVPGDLDCDGVVSFGDIDPFVLALSDPAGYAQAYPGCPLLNADCNGDGQVNFADIDPFVALLSG